MNVSRDASINVGRRLLVVSSNLSSECWVLSVPDVLRGEGGEGFVIEEPDDEQNFTMVDKGAIFVLRQLGLAWL